MMITCRFACAALLAAAVAAPASAQSLGEVARKEQARRAEVKAPSKVYSNTDLKPGDVSLESVAKAEDEPCYMSASRNKCVTADEMLGITSKNVANAELKKSEPAFRSKAQGIRERLEKANAELTVMIATAGDANRSDVERAVASQRVADRRIDVADLEKQWLKLETDAGKMAIPHEWLEPIPEISSRTPQQ